MDKDEKLVIFPIFEIASNPSVRISDIIGWGKFGKIRRIKNRMAKGWTVDMDFKKEQN